MNKWKIFAYTVITWLVFSALAKGMVYFMQEVKPNYSMVDAQSVVWSWASLLMGIIASIRFKRWLELMWGILFFIICLLPIVGMFAGIGYFAWSYVKLERHRNQQSSGSSKVNRP